MLFLGLLACATVAAPSYNIDNEIVNLERRIRKIRTSLDARVQRDHSQVEYEVPLSQHAEYVVAIDGGPDVAALVARDAGLRLVRAVREEEGEKKTLKSLSF